MRHKVVVDGFLEEEAADLLAASLRKNAERAGLEVRVESRGTDVPEDEPVEPEKEEK